jgi:hypothetical protein
MQCQCNAMALKLSIISLSTQNCSIYNTTSLIEKVGILLHVCSLLYGKHIVRGMSVTVEPQ